MKPIRAEQLFRQIEEISGSGIPVAAAADSRSGENASGFVNWTLARQAVNGDLNLLDQVLAAFLEEGPQLVNTMRTALASGEWKRFQRAAHTLKSALRTFGVDAADRVEELEMIAKGGGTAIDPATVASILIAVQPVLNEMERHLNSRRAIGTI